MASVEDLAYRDLQAECRSRGLPAKGTRAELLARLEQPQQQQYRAGAGASPQAQTPAGGPRQKPASGQLLAAAAKTSLPKTPPDKGGSPGLTPAAAAAAAARAHKRQQRPGAAGRTLSQLVLAAAACALLLALAVPAWLRRDGWADRLRQRYPGPAQHAEQAALAAARLLSALHAALPESAQHHFAQGHGLLQRHWQAAHRQCAYLWTSLQRWLSAAAPGKPGTEVGQEGEVPSGCSGLLDIAALDSILPPGPQWANLKQAVAAAWEGQRADPTQASAMLFACSSQSCGNVADWLAWAAPEDCRLRLEAAELGDDRGALQKRLAAFLGRQPRGAVVLANMHQLSPRLVPVLINALSEQGAFQQDGRAVRTGGATFLLTMEVQRSVLEAESEDAFKAAAKSQLVEGLVGRAADAQEARLHAQALRRRIQYVLPTLG